MSQFPRYLALISMPGGSEWLIIGIIALLLFGKRLPEVSRSLGRSVMEFKKGLSNMEDDIQRGLQEDHSAALSSPNRPARTDIGSRTSEPNTEADPGDIRPKEECCGE